LHPWFADIASISRAAWSSALADLGSRVSAGFNFKPSTVAA
jgi:hypothetical protein